MNQGRIWCVVNPTVGLPLFLGSVAITSFVVHFAVLSHTTWMGNYWQGGNRKTAENSQPAVAAAKTDAPYVVSIAPVAGTPGKTDSAFVVTVSPNPAAVTTTASVAPSVTKSVALASAKSD